MIKVSLDWRNDAIQRTLTQCFAVAFVMATAIATGASVVDEYVNTGIGSISHMLVPTFRTVQRPNALYRFNGPAGQFTEHEVDGVWLHNPGHRDQPVFRVFGPTTWDQEHATPYSYDIYLEKPQVKFSIAPGERGGVAVFDFEGENREVVFALKDKAGFMSVSGVGIDGVDVFHGMRGCKTKVYLHGEFDLPPVAVESKESGLVLKFASESARVRMRFAVSYLSSEQAKRNLAEESGGFDFGQISLAAKRRWNDVLSMIDVEGGSENARKVFYTALWRCHERMVDITESGGVYLGYDGEVHKVLDSVRHYTDDWIWDTFRAAHPLMTILHPKAEGDKLASYIRMAEQDPENWMPVFPSVAGDRHCMINRHVSIAFLDAWRKGIRNFDLKKGFELQHHTEETESLIPWYRGPLTDLDRFYKKNGYYPGLRKGENETVKGVMTEWERRQSVSVTQGASYDAWAMAEMAKEIGADASIVNLYSDRAKGYRLLWNAKTQFFHPKDAVGEFIEPFDYDICGGFGARNYFTENNAWTYVWDVQHDLPGLVGLFGSKAAMEKKLDLMLSRDVPCRWKFTAQMPDGCTGLMGSFTMANEPSFHIPYLYNFVGRPDKTQKFVRRTLDCWFRNDRMGMCGDEDGGGMSAYAVFSMMGFYPVTPGVPEYQWGSPVFKRVVIHLENGHDFVLEAPDADEDTKYVRRVSIDGRAVDVLMPLPHDALVRGAHVRIDLSQRPVCQAQNQTGE